MLFNMEYLFGVNINPSVKNLEEAFKIAEHADSLGVDLVGMQDHPYNPSFLDTWTLLSTLGAKTKRIHLMINVADLPLRHPALLAKAAATLDLITNGRVELGLGAGVFWDGVESFGGPKRSPSQAVEAFEEALKIIKLFFDQRREEEAVSFKGKHYALNNAQLGPKPFHPIRLWVGGYGGRMLALTGRLADGLTVSLPYLPPQELPSKLKVLRDAASKVGRDPSTIMVNYNFGGLILTSEKEGSYVQKSDRVIMGTVDEWVKTLVDFERLGVNAFSFWPTGTDRITQIRLYAEEVVPRVKEALQR